MQLVSLAQQDEDEYVRALGTLGANRVNGGKFDVEIDKMGPSFVDAHKKLKDSLSSVDFKFYPREFSYLNDRVIQSIKRSGADHVEKPTLNTKAGHGIPSLLERLKSYGFKRESAPSPVSPATPMEIPKVSSPTTISPTTATPTTPAWMLRKGAGGLKNSAYGTRRTSAGTSGLRKGFERERKVAILDLDEMRKVEEARKAEKDEKKAEKERKIQEKQREKLERERRKEEEIQKKIEEEEERLAEERKLAVEEEQRASEDKESAIEEAKQAALNGHSDTNTIEDMNNMNANESVEERHTRRLKRRLSLSDSEDPDKRYKTTTGRTTLTPPPIIFDPYLTSSRVQSPDTSLSAVKSESPDRADTEESAQTPERQSAEQTAAVILGDAAVSVEHREKLVAFLLGQYEPHAEIYRISLGVANIPGKSGRLIPKEVIIELDYAAAKWSKRAKPIKSAK
ncbi:hypothetical protein SpCBS45565_g04458 [Spizellomyces sp. 'palustris']|nr:hypothetical protein SpCBS45565_g04458 [Spizellomyces sp. 'palustris']